MDKLQIGQIWESNSAPYTIRILNIYKGKEWIDKDFNVIVFEYMNKPEDDSVDGIIYEHHLLQMFHLKENK